jgi:hypothetical protein
MSNGHGNEQTDEREATLARPGEITGMGLLDLSALTTPEDLAAITGIHKVGGILVPEALLPRLMGIPMSAVGTIVPVPAGERVRVLTGQVKLTGEALASPGGDGEILLVVGQLIVTTPVERVGYQGLHVYGQVIAPKGSETAIGSALRRLNGQTIYYTGEPRFFAGNDRFGRGFFEALERPVALVLAGNYVVEADVSADLLKEKVAQLILAGTLRAPRALVPLLQARCELMAGTIVPLDGDGSAAGAQTSGTGV